MLLHRLLYVAPAFLANAFKETMLSYIKPRTLLVSPCIGVAGVDLAVQVVKKVFLLVLETFVRQCSAHVFHTMLYCRVHFLW